MNIIKRYGWNHWWNHTNNGLLIQFILSIVSIPLILGLIWILFSITFIADPGNIHN
jgi:hypothetical protein